MVRPYGFRKFDGYAKNHPVRLRLPPLHRRGMVRPYDFRKFGGYAKNHPVRLRLPPLQEGNTIFVKFDAGTQKTTPSGWPATPPQEGNGSSVRFS